MAKRFSDPGSTPITI